MWDWTLLSVFAFLVGRPVVNCSSNNIYEALPNAFFKDCLFEINKYRQIHGAYPLRWSADLQYHAQLRADKLSLDTFLKNDVDILDRLGQGETVSYLSPPKQMCRTYPPSGDCYACRDTIATWYNESKHYNYETGYSVDGTKQVLHFTQLVWKDTVKVGLAIANSPRYGVVTVARYHPRGNIGFLDDYVRNVASKGSGGNDGFDGNDEDGSQGGPPCRNLKKRRADKDCVNAYGDDNCDFHVQRFPGYCEYNELFMKKNCAKSCGACNVRFPAPPVFESKEGKKLDLRWEIGKWFECHGGLQRRLVECFHKFDGHDFLVKPKFCQRALGEKPLQYKDCS